MKCGIKKFLSVILSLAVTFSFVVLPFNENQCKNVFGLVSNAEDFVNCTFTAEFRQTSARNMTELINDFRTGENAWAYDNKNNKVIYSGLEKLTYDYELEEAAIQRASELVALYSHTRPDGSDFDTAYSEIYGNSYKAENIAIGNICDTQAAFEMWKEEDEDYNGQGHRRNMLNDKYKSVAIAHIYYKGCHYWVQEFSSVVSESVKTDANDNLTEISLEIPKENIESSSTSIEYSAASVRVNEENDLPQISQTIKLKDQWSYAPQIDVKTNSEWNCTGESVEISDGKFKGISEGKGILTTNCNGKTFDVIINVIKNDDKNFVVDSFYNSVSEYKGNCLNVIVPSLIDGVKITEIDSNCFNLNNAVHSLKFSEGITTINSCAVTNCKNLKSIYIPESVTYIDDYAFGYSENSFKIYCYPQSAGEKFAKENNFEYEYLLKCSHDFEEQITQQPTCTKTGILIKTCRICGLTENVILPQKEHSYSEWTVDKEATCTEKGEKIRICRVCNHTEKEEIPKTDCVFDTEWTIDKIPTCTETGQKSHHCKNCNEKKDITEIPKSEHSFGEWETTRKPTCVLKGEQTRQCKNCGETQTREIDIISHNYAETVVMPTCEDYGYTRYKCTVCGHFYDDAETEPLGHDYETEWTVDIQPTCNKKGMKSRHCKKCNSTTDSEEIPVNSNNHNFTATVTPPACTEKGYTLYKCEDCGYSYKDNETKPTGKHVNSGKWIVLKNPTCTQTGKKASYCKVCGELTSEQIIEKTPHNYVISEIKPTSTSEGYTLHKCKECGYFYKDNYKAKIPDNKKINVQKTKKIPINWASVMNISSKNYTGKQVRPKVTVLLGKQILKKGVNYTVQYGKNKIGKGYVIIQGKGDFQGKLVKYFRINPRKTSFTAKSTIRKKISVKINKKPEASRYQIQYCKNKSFKGAKTITVKSTKVSLRATSKKTYFIRVRTLKIIGKSKYTSSWSSARKVRVK